MRPSRIVPSLIVSLLALPACAPVADLGRLPGARSDHLIVDQRGEIVFITQDAVAPAVMEALYSGTIAADEEGCLRLEPDDGEPVTAIWPYSFTLSYDGVPRVLDGDGAVVGTVGETFTLGGGLVSELAASYGFTEADRELAAARCPGSYWIVGEVPES